MYPVLTLNINAWCMCSYEQASSQKSFFESTVLTYEGDKDKGQTICIKEEFQCSASSALNYKELRSGVAQIFFSIWIEGNFPFQSNITVQ